MKKSGKAKEILKRLESMGSPEDAVFLQRFFKTGKGQYGEGDLFRGIRTSPLRALEREFKDLPPEGAALLLESPFHEDRAFAVIHLAELFERGGDELRERIYSLYMEGAIAGRVNNWDLVDISAPQIVGGYFEGKSKKPLRALAKSRSLWLRRIAIVSTLHFIRGKELDETFAIAEILLKDKEDLIHKASGWMLREAGKRDADAEESFLKKHAHEMPRTALRYAIERFPEERRLFWLAAGKGSKSRP